MTVSGEDESVDTQVQEKSPMSEQVEKPRSTEAIEVTHDHDHDHGEEPVKGDDSDGVVDWTMKNLLATFSLSALYVGSQLPLYLGLGSLPFIIQDIGGAEIQVWFATAYALCLASVAPFSGYMQDVFGRRTISITGGVILCMGLIVCATAHKIGQAIVGQALSGTGAAICELTAFAGTAELVPVRKRGIYIGLIILLILPFSPYPLYCTELSTHATWRWGFWICLIWNALSVVGIALTYWPQSQLRGDNKSRREILRQIDYVGGFLSTGALTLFLVGLAAGGVTTPWKSARVLAPLIIGILMIPVFGVWEWKFASFPMLPHRLFAGQRVVAMSFLVAFISGIYFYGLLNYTPVLYLYVFDPDPVSAGIKGMIIILGVTAGAVIPNMLLSVYKERQREILAGCALLATVFGTALVTAHPGNAAQTIAFATISGFGIGAMVACALTTAVTAAPDDSIATCVSLSISIRTVGGSVGTAINTNIFQSKLKDILPTYIAEYAVAAGLPESSATGFVTTFLTVPTNITQVPGVTADIVKQAKLGQRFAYAAGLKWVWYTMLPFGILSIIAALLLGDVTQFMTNRIAAKISHQKGAGHADHPEHRPEPQPERLKGN